jgi:hypothetical protein
MNRNAIATDGGSIALHSPGSEQQEKVLATDEHGFTRIGQTEDHYSCAIQYATRAVATGSSANSTARHHPYSLNEWARDIRFTSFSQVLSV